MCFPIAGTLMPTANEQVGQILLTMMDENATNPSPLFIRNIVSDLLDKLHANNQYPCVALELEFYLIDKKRSPSGELQTALNPKKKTREKKIGFLLIKKR